MSTVQPTAPTPQTGASGQTSAAQVEGRVTGGANALQSAGTASQAAQAAGQSAPAPQTQSSPQQPPAQTPPQAPAGQTSPQPPAQNPPPQQQPAPQQSAPAQTGNQPSPAPQTSAPPPSSPAPAQRPQIPAQAAPPATTPQAPPQPVPQDATVTRVLTNGTVSVRTAAGEATIQIDPRQIPAFLRANAAVTLTVRQTEAGLQVLLQPRGAARPDSAAATTARPSAQSAATQTQAPAQRALPPLADGQVARAIVLRPTSLPQGIASGPLPPTGGSINPQQAAQAAARYLLASSPQLRPAAVLPSVPASLAPGGTPSSVPAQAAAAPAQAAPAPGAAAAAPPPGQSPQQTPGAAPQGQPASPPPAPQGAGAEAAQAARQPAGSQPSPSQQQQPAQAPPQQPASAGQATVRPQAAAPGPVSSAQSPAPSQGAAPPAATVTTTATASTPPSGPAAGATPATQPSSAGPSPAPTAQPAPTAPTAAPAQGAAATATAPNPGSALPPGTDFPVRVLSVGQPASNALGAQPTSGGRVISGTIVGTGGNGQAIVNSSVGLLDVAARAESGQLQSEIRMEMMLSRAASESAARTGSQAPTPLAVLSREWPALEESMRALEIAAPQAAAQLAATVARPGPQLTASMLFFLAAVRGGSLGSWIGRDTNQALGSSNGRLLSALSGDFQSLNRASEGGPESAGWRAFFMPVQNNDALEQLRFFVLPAPFQPRDDGPDRDEEESEEAERDGETRFIVDLLLSGLGAFQIDGSVARKSLSLMIRTHRALPKEMRADIIDIFEKTAARTGMEGAVSFKVQKEFPPLPVAELLAGGQQGSDLFA